MSDISKCKGTDCPFREGCYRYTAPEGYWQAYFTGVPYNKETKKCEYLWER